jgi:hypothetical protein
LNDPVEKYMLPFRESRPLCGDLILENVVMRFLEDTAVPLVNDWGTCTGIVHRHDCTEVGCLPQSASAIEALAQAQNLLDETAVSTNNNI